MRAMKWLFAIGLLCVLVVFIQRANWSQWPAYLAGAWVLAFCYFGVKGFKSES